MDLNLLIRLIRPLFYHPILWHILTFFIPLYLVGRIIHYIIDNDEMESDVEQAYLTSINFFTTYYLYILSLFWIYYFTEYEIFLYWLYLLLLIFSIFWLILSIMFIWWNYYFQPKFWIIKIWDSFWDE